MLMITSPAKTLDLSSPWKEYVSIPVTKPRFEKEAERIMTVLRKYDCTQLQHLLSVSPRLAEENRKRNLSYTPEHSPENARPAILTYKGDIYQQLHAKDYTPSQQQYIQDTLRILSGLYGILRPYDLIQPYRLEMKTPLSIGGSPSLYAFWSENVTQVLREEINARSASYVVNLASGEYADVVDRKQLPVPVVDILFTQKKNEKIFNFGFYAKRARGKMIEHLSRIKSTSLEGVRAFSEDGYRLVVETSRAITFCKDIS